ncbi:MAG: membrane protein insertase YidC, partial [Candidatus Adiutrix sp.]|nr:membrane protein insertase YidC [Candidatus Adiutrix sp.]
MDKRFFWIMSVFLVAVIGWTLYFPPQPAEQAAEAPGATPVAVENAAPAVAPPAEVPAPVPTRRITVTTPQYTAVFDEDGGRLSSFKLADYFQRKTNPNQPDEMLELVNQPHPDDRSMRLGLTEPGAPKLENAPYLADQESLTVGAGETKTLTMTYRDPSGLIVTRELSFSGDSFLIGQNVTLENQGQTLYDGYLTMRLNSAPFSAKGNRNYNEMGAFINNGLVNDTPADAAEALADFRGKLTSVDWIGYMDQYFLTALVVPDQSEIPEAVPPSLSAAFQDHGGLAVGISWPLNLAPAQKKVLNYDFYYGPKSAEALKAAGHKLDRSVDLGWFYFLAAPLAKL